MDKHIRTISCKPVAASSTGLVTWKQFVINALIAVNDLLARKATAS